MWKNFIALSIILILSACNATGYSANPWKNNANGSAAAAPPKPLTGETSAEGKYDHVIRNGGVLENSDGSVDMAGLEYTPNDKGAPYQQQSPYNNTAMDTAIAPVKVALLVPLSGPHKDLGQAFLQASQMAMFDMDFPAIEIMPRDTGGDAKMARTAAESAINDGAELILGPLFAHSVKAVKPIARRSNINMISFSTDWSLAGGNTYIMGFLPFAQVQRVAEYALANNYNKIGILAPNTDYGNAVISAYNSLTYRAGVPRAEIAKFSGDDNQISDTIRRFTNYESRFAAAEEGQKPVIPFDAILMPVGGDQARSIASLLSYYDLDEKTVKRLGTGLWDDSGLAAEKSLNYSWFAAPSPDTRRDFESRFRQLYGFSAPRLATLSYDATALAIVLARKGYQEGLLQSASYGRESIFAHSQISNANGFSGVDGIFRFRPDSLVERGLAVLEIKDGSIRVIDPAPTTFQRRSDY
jgi:branched-chain amino acid transport system substrate-binding protein